MSQSTGGRVGYQVLSVIQVGVLPFLIRFGGGDRVSSDSGQASCLIKWGLSGGYHVSYDSAGMSFSTGPLVLGHLIWSTGHLLLDSTGPDWPHKFQT